VSALQCMHSQAVDIGCSKLVLEPSTKWLFGASLHPSKGECISVHSLDAEVRQGAALWAGSDACMPVCVLLACQGFLSKCFGLRWFLPEYTWAA
jgi:hypothetical protein